MFPTGLGFYSIGLCLNGRGKLVSDQGALILSNLFPLEDQNKIRISSGLIIMCIIQVFLSFFLICYSFCLCFGPAKSKATLVQIALKGYSNL